MRPLWLTALIAVLPFSALRILLYRILCGYQISWNSEIGFGSIIRCEQCRIESGRVGFFNYIACRSFSLETRSQVIRMNKFLYVNAVEIGPNVTIRSRNSFVGTRGFDAPFKDEENIRIGKDSIITIGHSFDLSDSITIGENVTFGGNACEVWTHGFDINHIKVQAPVFVGNDVYIGSRSIIIQGVRICNRVSIGAGTVVSKSISESGFYISSGLIRKADLPDYSESAHLLKTGTGNYVRK